MEQIFDKIAKLDELFKYNAKIGQIFAIFHILNYRINKFVVVTNLNTSSYIQKLLSLVN